MAQRKMVTAKVQEKTGQALRLQQVTAVGLLLGAVSLVALAAAIVNQLNVPEPKPLRQGTFAANQVIFKVKPGIDANQAFQRAVSQEQTIFREMKTGKTYSVASDLVKKSPERFQKTKLKLTTKKVQRVLANGRLTDEVRKKILSRPGAIDPEMEFKKRGLDRWYVAEVKEKQVDIPALIAKLQSDRGRIEGAGPSSKMHPTATTVGESLSLPPTVPLTSMSPDDEGYRSQWGLQAMKAEGAWTLTTGRPETIIAVVDTGMDWYHPELVGRDAINQAENLNKSLCADYWPTTETKKDCRGQYVAGDLSGDGATADEDHNGYVNDINGMSFWDGYEEGGKWINGDDGPIDEEGHGTAVAGIVGARTNNGQGIAGVCWNCSLLPVKVGDNEGADLEDAVRGIQYAVLRGADVISLLVATETASIDTILLQDAITVSRAAGVSVVAASGNDNQAMDHVIDPSDPDQPAESVYPAVWPEVITVGAARGSSFRTPPYDRWIDPVSSDGQYQTGSNYGSALDLIGPGESILTLSRRYRDAEPPEVPEMTDYYLSGRGTTMGAAHVAGVVGLMLSANAMLTPTEVASILTDTATELPTITDENNRSTGGGRPNLYVGYGLVNAEQAVREAINRRPDFVFVDQPSVHRKPGLKVQLGTTIGNEGLITGRNIPYVIVDAATNQEISKGVIGTLSPQQYSTINTEVTVAGTTIRLKITIDPDNLIGELSDGEDNVQFIDLPPDSSPVISAVSNKSVDEGQTVTFSISAVDPDGPLRYEIFGRPEAATFINQTFSWSPVRGDAGDHTVTFTVTDTKGFYSSISIVITVINPDAPVLQDVPRKMVNTGDVLSFALSATDRNGPAGLVYTLEPLPAGATFTNNTFSWTPGQTQVGTYVMNGRVTDSSGFFDEQQVTITVNHVARADLTVDGLVSSAVRTVSNAQLIRVHATIQNIGDGTIRGLTSIPYELRDSRTKTLLTTGSITNPSALGTTVISHTVDLNTIDIPVALPRIGRGRILETTALEAIVVTIDADNRVFELSEGNNSLVLPVTDNSAPSFDPSTTINRVVDEGKTIFFQIKASDGEQQPISYSYAANPAITAQLDPASGEFNWIPSYDQAGTYSITVSASDGDLSSNRSFVISVANALREPFHRAIAGAPVDLFTPNALDKGFLVTHWLSPDFCDAKNTGTVRNRCRQYSQTNNVYWLPGYVASDVQYIRVKFAASKWNAPLPSSYTKIHDGAYGWKSGSQYIFDLYPSPGYDVDPYFKFSHHNDPNYFSTLSFLEQDFIGRNYGTSGYANASTHWKQWIDRCMVKSLGQENGLGVRAWTRNGALNTIAFCLVDHSAGVINPSWEAEIHLKSLNEPPALQSLPNKTVHRGQPLSFTVVPTDHNEDHVTMTATQLPSGAVFDATTGVFSWTSSTSGSYVASFRADDGIASSPVLTVPITVANQAPTLSLATNHIVVEAGRTAYLSFTRSDPDQDPLTVSASGFYGNIATHWIEFAPPANTAGGDYTGQLRVTDGELSATRDYTVTVIGGPDPIGDRELNDPGLKKPLFP